MQKNKEIVISRQKILLVFGTRPEAIKMAPAIQEMKRHPQRLEPVVCVTAQHREMLDGILECFGIIPDFDLALMREDQSLSQVAAGVITGVSNLLREVRPHLVLVQGDTTSALAAALAAFHHRIPVGHIEAGLRTGDPWQPFPEEMNRRQISLLASYHFAPTRTAVEALRAAGVPKKAIFLTGNTGIDAFLMTLRQEIRRRTLSAAGERKIILVTAHRRENFGAPLREICLALSDLARLRRDVEIVYPVHPNPQVCRPVFHLLRNKERITLLPSLGYPEFVHLMARSHLILTDSGGIQEEAPSLGKPVLILRRTTERPEALQAGGGKLVGTDRERIVREVEILLDRENSQPCPEWPLPNPFGDGKAAARIVRVLMRENGREGR